MPTAPNTYHSQLDNTTLALLEPALPGQNVLSIVLDVNSGSAPNQGGSLHLRAHQLLNAVSAPAALATAVMDDLDDAQRHTRTRLSFLWDDHGHVQRQTVDTQMNLGETSRYGAPDLEPLHFALESSARVLLVVMDDQWGRLLSIHLGEITELYRLENVMNADDTFRTQVLPPTDPHPLQSAAEETPGDAPVQHQGAQQDGRFHHALMTQVQRLHDVGVFEQLLIAGSLRGRADFHALLGPNLERTFAGEFAAPGDATAAALLTAAHPALLSLEEQRETDVLDEALARGMHGAGPTLDAAQEGRVAQLLVSGDGSAQRVWQDSSGHVFPEPPAQGISPLTGGAVTERTLRDVLPLLRERHGLHVRFLTGPRAERLDAQMGSLAGVARS
ncbi:MULTISPECIES: hypothetical protein [unclassified Deinococcus]|uniref:baeRF10 domain-containing protein n=1 Tax=unclassified Deinococcus TaxID=2623546 RepID=UPI000C183ED0|nr:MULTISPECIES: hypothetical protein [unclassified Deinococcus]MCD0168196.1 hypothetical protein [Deinococcus sp. 23YEL01]PIG98245.1 hypothetical protein AMD26_008855 [Deinococcus sp. UR1]